MPCRAVLAWRASCWCGCQGPVRTRPASSRQTCCRHIQCSQGSSSQLLPPTDHSPTWPRSMGAITGHTLATGPCSLPSSSCISGVQARVPRHCPWLQPHSSHSLTGVQSTGQTGLCRQGQAAWLNAAQHRVARCRAGCLSESQPPVQLSRSHICWSHHGCGQWSWEHVVRPHLHQ